MRLAPWVLLMLAALLLLSGCNYQPQGQIGPLFEPPKPKPADPQEEFKAYLALLGCQDVNSLDACSLKRALKGGKISYCRDISDSLLRDECYAQVALQTRQPNSCAGIRDPGTFDSCYLDLYKALKDFKLPCQILKKPENQAWCRENVEAVFQKKEAEQKPFIDLCSKRSKAVIGACIDSVQNETMDETFCDPFGDAPIKESCLLLLAQRLSKYSLCAQIMDVDRFNQCVTNQAVAQASTGPCKEAKSEQAQLICLRDVGILLKSEATCRSLSASLSQALRFECFDGIAGALDDPTLCEEIKHLDEQGFCVGKIAVNRKDSALCAKVKNEALDSVDPFLARDSCYVYAAEHLHRPEACDLVHLQVRKDDCASHVAAGTFSDSVFKQSAPINPSGPKTCVQVGGRVCPADANCMSAPVSMVDTYDCCLSKCLSAAACTSNSDCDDHNPSTFDECVGSPAACAHRSTTTCQGGDGFCPSGCDHSNDSDCTADACTKDVDCDTAEKRAQCLKGTCVLKTHPYYCQYAPNPSVIC